MVLDGQFSYDDSNQRALPFNVYIEEINGPLRTYLGSNSEFRLDIATILQISHCRDCFSQTRFIIFLVYLFGVGGEGGRGGREPDAVIDDLDAVEKRRGILKGMMEKKKKKGKREERQGRQGSYAPDTKLVERERGRERRYLPPPPTFHIPLLQEEKEGRRPLSPYGLAPWMEIICWQERERRKKGRKSHNRKKVPKIFCCSDCLVERKQAESIQIRGQPD